ncbi:MAG: hypothetical protein KBF88_10810, partial [Polyangiaceae bacterium]|nr:hypothetical protein [Polyangiaceae bacterium]
ALVGVNDNVSESTDQATGETLRNGAAFTALAAAFTLRSITPRASYVLLADARLNLFTRFDGADSNASQNANGSFAANWELAPRTHLSLTTLGQFGKQTFTRLSENTLTRNFDRLAEGSLVGFLNNIAGLTFDLSNRTRVTFTGSLALNATFDAPPFPLADGLQLDRRGLDGLTLDAGVQVFHDFADRDTGILGLNYGYITAPYSINSFVVPPQIGGPQRTQRIVGDVGYQRRFSDKWSSTTRVGVSVNTVESFDPDSRLNVLPVGSQDFSYISERFIASVQASFSYASIVPRLGTGPLFNLTAQISGTPFVESWIKKLVLVGSSSFVWASTTVLTNQSVTNQGLGGTIELRYPITKTLGFHVGYDLFITRTQTVGDASLTHRNMLFTGVSAFWSTSKEIQPIGTRVLPAVQ